MGGIILIEQDDAVSNEFTERFRNCSVEELIETFNGDVGGHGALSFEFRQRRFKLRADDYLSLDHRIKLSDDGKSLIRATDT